MRRLRTILLTIGCAVLGVVAGRWYARTRRDGSVGAAPIAPTAPIALQDVVPGIILAFRLRGEPWKRFGLPSWLVAFAVNGLMHAYKRELAPLFRALGLATPGAGTDGGGDAIDVPHRPGPDPTPDLAPIAPPAAPFRAAVAGSPAGGTPTPEARRPDAPTAAPEQPAVAPAVPVTPAPAATDAPVWSPAGPAIAPRDRTPPAGGDAPADAGSFIPFAP